LGFAPVAIPIARKVTFLVPDLPVLAGKTSVRVPVAPGARFVTAITLLSSFRLVEVRKVPAAVTLVAVILPVFFKEIVTRYVPFAW
jgi:hypothetical protein